MAVGPPSVSLPRADSIFRPRSGHNGARKINSSNRVYFPAANQMRRSTKAQCQQSTKPRLFQGNLHDR